MTRVTADWVTDAPARALFSGFADAGYEALFVGGCVRNALLSAPVSDLDVTTNAHPDQVMTLADQQGWRAIPTGIDHGTVTIIVDGTVYEVTTYRRDTDTDGRHATVAFSQDYAEDAQRRDFTMNALYAQPDGGVRDPVGGLADLAARRVRFIGQAEDRIQEDYLRILRFFRFHAWYGADAIDADGLAACAAHTDGIARLSKERITAEMAKLLAASDPGPA
ncbi:MAG: CCA tRNA nucleotidyltransferase, partial [Pseudomonadota bacterium]